ncbi:MAG: tetratricopeptide repeat protein, partial [Myxococcota bacterium]
MHEGMAKFLERRWRGKGEHRLPPTSEQILSKRFEAKKLVTFEQMHPSMALLPSAEDAAVAYAQVYTIMEYLHQEKGPGSLAKVLEEIDRGKDAQDAYAAVLGVDFATFETTRWPKFLSKRRAPKLPDDAELPNELKFKDSVKQGTSELDEIPTPAARDHAVLGQMLQTRGRYGAAAVQYQKAIRLEPAPNPVLAARMGSCLNAVGKFEDALRQLKPTLELYPSYVTLWLEIGRAALGAGKYTDAREYLLEAARINPFNPEIHQLLVNVFENLGDEARAKQERELSAMVM